MGAKERRRKEENVSHRSVGPEDFLALGSTYAARETVCRAARRSRPATARIGTAVPADLVFLFPYDALHVMTFAS